MPELGGGAEGEFGRSDLIDGRLRERLVQTAGRWMERAGCSLAEMFPGEAEHRAALRFLHNPRVEFDDILQPHRKATLQRVRRHAVVLVVQDTTTINLDNLRESASGLGVIGGRGRIRQSHGLQVHASVAFTDRGRALGVVGLEVQASRSRKRQCHAREGRQVWRKDLWQLVEPLPPVVRNRIIEIAACGAERARPARSTRTELRACRAEMQPPKERPEAEPLSALLVRARD